MYIYVTYIIYIYHWRIFFRSSYRNLAWVGFEPTTTEFHSDTLTNWSIRPWVQLALRANFVQLLQFHLFVQCSRFILAIAFVSRHICFKQNLAQVIMLVAEWIEFSLNIKYKTVAKNYCEKNQYQFLNNLIFNKTIQNNTKRQGKR